MHGSTNAVTHLQFALALTLPTDLRLRLLEWLADIPVYSPTEDVLLDILLSLSEHCADWNVKLHP